MMATKYEVERWKDLNRMLTAALNRSIEDKNNIIARIKDNYDKMETAKAVADGLEWQVEELQAENAKLRELAVGMAKRVTNPTGGCLAPGCAHGCPHHLECNEELHTCWYVDRMRELGIEVE